MQIERVVIGLVLLCSSIPAGADCAAQAKTAQQRMAHEQAKDLPELLTPELRASFPTAQVQQAYDALTAKWGNFQQAGAAMPMERDGHHLAIVPLVYAHGQVNFVVACDANQMIDGIHFVPARGEAP